MRVSQYFSHPDTTERLSQLSGHLLGYALGSIHRRLLALAMLLLSFLLVACGNAENSFFPLHDGWAWHYDVSKTTMDGSFRQKYIVQSLPKLDWQGEESVPIVSAAGEQYLYQQTASAILRVAFKGRDDTDFAPHAQAEVVIPETLQAGHQWQQVSYTRLLENTGPPWETLFRIVQPVEMRFQVDALDGAVTVPAGSFNNCLKISGFGETNVNVGNYIGRTVISVQVEHWYAKGVGLVKSVRKETTTADAINLGTLTLELEYSVN